MTYCRRSPVLTVVFFSFFFLSHLQAQRPSQQFKSTLIAGRIEPKVRAFVSSCLGSDKLPKPTELYSQGAWFVTPSLASHLKDQGADDSGNAQIWEHRGKEKAISIWVHDDEFDRHILACINSAGTVTRLVNEYMPGLSEPDLHWIYIRTYTLAPDHKYRASSRYTDWNRHSIPPPKLTSEDRDFIAGERRYTGWSDFDFSGAYDQDHPETKAH